MQQIIKHFIWISLLALGVQTSMGFALIGPLGTSAALLGADNWETAALGYDYAYTEFGTPGGPVFLGDIGDPRNIGQEYRRDVPVMYYSYDSSFSGFFGADGEAAVDGAFAIMNAVPSADNINLNNYPDQALQANYTAMGVYVTDLKSLTLHLLVEQIGLADPERYVWTLHDRATFTTVPPTTCPEDVEYTVVQRNYDESSPSAYSLVYSPYVNDTLYSYFIAEFCAATANGVLATTVPFSTDPEASVYTSVAANVDDGTVGGPIYLNPSDTQPITLNGGLQVGMFFTGLTKDDVAAIRYIYDTNNVNYELPDGTSLEYLVQTNTQVQALFPASAAVGGTNTATTTTGYYTFDGNYGYGDYGALWQFAQTNGPAAVQAAYPGINISSSLNYFVVATNWNYTQYYTNEIGAPAGTLTLVTVSNKVLVPLEKWTNVFANVFLYNVKPTTTAKRQVISVGPNVGAPAGSPAVTNVTSKSVTLNLPSGAFFVLPMFQTNVCPIAFIHPLITNVLAYTNYLTASTTNVATTTNTSAYSSALLQINYFTNYIWSTYQVTCGDVPNPPNYYQGNGGVKFMRQDYDSAISQYFIPVTNYYNMVILTNYQWQVRPFVRVVTQPDILFAAADQGEANTFVGSVVRGINFTPSPILNGLAGPGTIDSPTTIEYNEMGDVFRTDYFEATTVYADTNEFLSQGVAIPAIAWGSFSYMTNVEVYPNWVSLQNLQNQLAVTLSPAVIPTGAVGSDYSVLFSASGGPLTGALTWTATGSPAGNGLYYGLPPGLSLSPTGELSGTPTTAGTYDFALTVTDSPSGAVVPHVITWNLSITIN